MVGYNQAWLLECQYPLPLGLLNSKIILQLYNNNAKIENLNVTLDNLLGLHK